MKLPRIFLAALTVSLSFVALGVGATPPAPLPDIVARFEGSTQANIGGHQSTAIVIMDLATGKKATVPIPNVTVKVDKTDKVVPKQELVDAVKKLTAGQIVKISVEPSKDMGTVLSSIDPYELKPGEDTPNGYVFSKTFPGKKDGTIASVVLTKFGVEHNFTIGMKKGASGQEQDPDVLAELAKLSADSPVWVQTQGRTVITVIEPYTEPLTGKVTKVADADVDGHKVKSAEIDTDGGKSVTVYVPGKESGKTFVQDSLILSQLGRVKVGSQVVFRVHEDGDKVWLREIEVAKPAPKKPTEKPAAPAKK